MVMDDGDDDGDDNSGVTVIVMRVADGQQSPFSRSFQSINQSINWQFNQSLNKALNQLILSETNN